MTWLRLATSPWLAGTVALCAAASLGACHLIGGAGDLTFDPSVGGAGGDSSTGGHQGGSDGLPLGAECGDAADACASGFCVDGVCCDGVCDGGCDTCRAIGLEGTCSPDVGETCDGGVCDGAGRCANGNIEYAVIGGSGSFDRAGRGSLDGDGLRFVGRASNDPISFGPLMLDDGGGNDRAFLGFIDDTPTGTLVGLGNPDGTQAFSHIATFPNEGYVVAGSISGTLPLSPVPDLEAPPGTTIAVVVAFDGEGTPLWGVTLSSANAAPEILALDASANQVAVAFTNETTGAERHTLAILSRTTGGQVATLDWDLGTAPGRGALTAVAFDPSGELWAAGWCDGTGELGEANMQSTTAGPEPNRIVPILVRYDQTYDIVLGPVALGTGVDVRPSALSASADDVYMAGTLRSGTLTKETVDGDPVVLSADTNGEDPFVLAMANDGRARWGTSFVAGASAMAVPGLAHDPGGNVAFGGWLEAGIVTLGQTNVGSAGEVASFIAKLLPGGQVAWVESDSSNMDEARVNWVGIDGQGRPWVTGESAGNVFGASGRGDVDMFLLRLAP